MSKNKIWFVTGASKGMGLTLVKKLLDQNYQVAATSRTVEELEKAVGKHVHFLPLQLNLIDEIDVKKAIAATIEHFGGLDVVVNNAGYGQVGPFEEISDGLVRKNFDVNVFGTFNVIRNALPQLRKQKSGYIFNFSSIAGYYGFPLSAIYSATKFAVDGMSEALAQEVKLFGINVISVKPGMFRTKFLDPGSLSASESNHINDYETVRKEQESALNEYDGKQLGDPDKAMDLLIHLSKEENPPMHFFLGADAYEVANTKIASVQKDINEWKELAASTDF